MATVEDSLEPHDAADLEIASEKIANEGGVLLMEGPVLDSISERNDAPHPYALLLGGGDLVPDSLAGDLSLELGEGQEHVEPQSSMLVVVLNAWVTETNET